MIINLASKPATVEGRSIRGQALSFNQVYEQVQDLPPFTFAPGATSKTLAENPSFQLHWQHKEASSMPLGVVNFTATDDKLLYEAKFSKTRASDEVLELINDGALTDVSVGFVPLQKRNKPQLSFTEIKLLELSVVDKGALHDAKITEAFAFDYEALLEAQRNKNRLRLLTLSRI